MSAFQNATVVVIHGAWADGSSWEPVIRRLQSEGLHVVAAPIPLTSLSDDATALRRTIARTQGPVIVAGHAYAGAVVGTAYDERVKALVYIAALAPDEGETVAQVFYQDEPHPKAPKLAPDADGFIWMPDESFAEAFAQNATREQIALCRAVQRPISVQEHPGARRRSSVENQARVVSDRGRRPDDQPEDATLHGRAHERHNSLVRCRPHTAPYRARQGRGHHPRRGEGDIGLRMQAGPRPARSVDQRSALPQFRNWCTPKART